MNMVTEAAAEAVHGKSSEKIWALMCHSPMRFQCYRERVCNSTWIRSRNRWKLDQRADFLVLKKKTQILINYWCKQCGPTFPAFIELCYPWPSLLFCTWRSDGKHLRRASLCSAASDVSRRSALQTASWFFLVSGAALYRLRHDFFWSAYYCSYQAPDLRGEHIALCLLEAQVNSLSVLVSE